jgi:hypothetical protein
MRSSSPSGTARQGGLRAKAGPRLGLRRYRFRTPLLGQRRSRIAVARAIPGGRIPVSAKPFLIGEILVTYASMRVRMSRADLRDLVRSVRAEDTAGSAPLTPQSPDARLVALRLGNAVSRTLRVLPTDSRCLVQSLVLSRLLSARGLPTRLVIGARTSPEFEAHAWVEYDGQPVLPSQGFTDSRLLEL